MFRKSHLLATALALAAIGSTMMAGAAAEARLQLHAQATDPAPCTVDQPFRGSRLPSTRCCPPPGFPRPT